MEQNHVQRRQLHSKDITRRISMILMKSCRSYASQRYRIQCATFRQYRTIGFIGIGNMGFPMLKNLLSKLMITDNRENTEVLVFDTDKEAMARAQRLGATQTNSLTQIAKAQPQIIITVLPTCSSSMHVISELIHHPILSSNDARPCIFIDCSTIAISSSRINHSLVQNTKSHVYMDAPISGGVKGAQDGTLTFMMGTDSSEEVINQVRPILHYMGKTIHICGGPGLGIAAKLCNNLALATQMIGICEAMNLGVKLGLDPLVLTNVMNSSTAGCWSSRMNNPHTQVATALGTGAAANNYAGGFASRLMLKDLGLVIKASEDAGVSLPLTFQAHELYRMLNIHGYQDKDFSVLLEFLKGSIVDK